MQYYRTNILVSVKVGELSAGLGMAEVGLDSSALDEKPRRRPGIAVLIEVANWTSPGSG